MGGIAISPNPVKTKVQLDINGNQVRPFTKEVIKEAEQPYAPTQEERDALAARPAIEPVKPGQSALGGVIHKKIEEAIGGAIVDAIKSINIESMITDAINKAIK